MRQLLTRRFSAVILDEAHFVKNERALSGQVRDKALAAISDGAKVSLHRTEMLSEICRRTRRVYCLTGTPVLSRPRELFNLLKITRHPHGRNFIAFSQRFCAGHQGEHGWSADGASNLLTLARELHNHILRRDKESVLRLPPKTVRVRNFRLNAQQREAYDRAWQDYLMGLRRTGHVNKVRRVAAAAALVRPTLLRQICSLAKVEPVIEEAVRRGEKFILFSAQTETLRAVSLH